MKVLKKSRLPPELTYLVPKWTNHRAGVCAVFGPHTHTHTHKHFSPTHTHTHHTQKSEFFVKILEKIFSFFSHKNSLKNTKKRQFSTKKTMKNLGANQKCSLKNDYFRENFREYLV